MYTCVPIDVNTYVCSLQPFYGAARLAFGQNPEVLPTTSTTATSTSTSTTTSTTTTTTTQATVQATSAGKDTNAPESDTLPLDVESVAANGQESGQTNPTEKFTEQIKPTAQRRSVPLKPQQVLMMKRCSLHTLTHTDLHNCVTYNANGYKHSPARKSLESVAF